MRPSFGTLVIAHAKCVCLFVLSLRDHRCKSCSSRETKSRRSSTPSRPRRSRTCGKEIWTPSSRPSRYALAIACLLSAIASEGVRWDTNASIFFIYRPTSRRSATSSRRSSRPRRPDAVAGGPRRRGSPRPRRARTTPMTTISAQRL